MESRTSKIEYIRHKYSGPRKNRKRIIGQMKRHHGEIKSRIEVWKNKKKADDNPIVPSCSTAFVSPAGPDDAWDPRSRPETQLVPFLDVFKQEVLEPEISSDGVEGGLNNMEKFPRECGVCRLKFESIDALSHHLSENLCSKVGISKQNSTKKVAKTKPIKVYERKPKAKRELEAERKRRELEAIAKKSKKKVTVKVETIDIPLKENGDDDMAKLIEMSFDKDNDNAEADAEGSVTEGDDAQRPQKRKRLACNACNLSFESQELLKAHMSKHRYQRDCLFCKIRFRNKKAYINHLKIHIDFQCPYCELAFTTEQQWKQHLVQHSEMVDYILSLVCEKCGEVFMNKEQLDAHRRMLDNLYQCHLCDESFARYKDLCDHLSQHPGFSAHRCDVCDAGFKVQSELRAHQLQHKVAYECDFCERGFSQRYMLTEHLSTHAPYPCHACGASFPFIDDLAAHMLSESHLYECNVCNKGYPHKRDFKIHLSSHKDEGC